MLTVGTIQTVVESQLVKGEISCPHCDGTLRPWWYGRPRTIRFEDGEQLIRPRRAKCQKCKKTHVLLPTDLLFRRRDSAAVIGAGLILLAKGTGVRKIASCLDRPFETVRGWTRRAVELAPRLSGKFIAILSSLGGCIEINPAGSPIVDALNVIGEVGALATRRGLCICPWSFASHVTNSKLLINTN